jgi:hypothetical protein
MYPDPAAEKLHQSLRGTGLAQRGSLARSRDRGSISAAIALERALRAWERDQDELDETIHRILTKDGINGADRPRQRGGAGVDRSSGPGDSVPAPMAGSPQERQHRRLVNTRRRLTGQAHHGPRATRCRRSSRLPYGAPPRVVPRASAPRRRRHTRASKSEAGTMADGSRVGQGKRRRTESRCPRASWLRSRRIGSGRA